MTSPYRSSMEHLADELTLADELVKAQTRRWRATIASTKSDWSMAYVDDTEVERYLGSRYHLGPLAADVLPVVDRDTIGRETIEERAAATRRAGRTLRLESLVARFDLAPVEREILLLTLLAELDSRYRRLFGYLLDDGTRWSPTSASRAQSPRPRRK